MEQVFPVIDAKGEIPSRERVDQAVRSWGTIPGYVRMFGLGYAALVTQQDRSRWVDLLRLSDDELVTSWRRRIDEADIPTTAEVVAKLRKAGVRRVCVHSIQPLEGGEWNYQASNDEVGMLVQKHPDFVLGFANANIFDGAEAIAEIKRAHHELGLIGMKVTPPFFKLYADDELLIPFYRLAEELGIIVWLHCGNHWRSEFVMDATHPVRVDRVACRFPNLRIIAGHAGWPWVLDAVVMSWRHKNVYLDTSAHRPKYLGKAGSGWEPLIQYGKSTIKDKVLFGSSWDILGRPMTTLVEEVRGLPLGDSVAKAWLYGNAARLFGLPELKTLETDQAAWH